jgi:hypothetical protein
MMAAAGKRWGENGDARFQSTALGREHRWVYRGQVIPADREVRVQATVSAVDENEKVLTADGLLSVDGRVIYQMHGFTLGWSRA